MAKIVNLNRARKSRARQQARDEADRNAVLYGLPKAEKKRAKDETEREARLLDASQIDRTDTPAPDPTDDSTDH